MVEQQNRVKRALISVSDKSGVEKLAAGLAQAGVELVSTGGTARALRDAGLDVRDVSSLTNFPEMMDGRIKTLHPGVHGGLLARRDIADHCASMSEYNISAIDLLVVNLYPFEETVAAGGDFNACVENIDIGGPAMIRAAAKNHQFVGVVTDPADYNTVLEEIGNSGALPFSLKRRLALKAFSMTSAYDSAISAWLARQEDASASEHFLRHYSVAGVHKSTLRYGENPHQSAALYLTAPDRPGVATAKQIQGKELSYNNINDTDAAYELIGEFDTSTPAVAIIKHANPCGVALGDTLASAYENALRCDPVSAFGGIVAMNQRLTGELAEKIIEVFTEVVIAPEMDEEAAEIFARKKNLRLLIAGGLPAPEASGDLVKPVAGGLLVQSRDNKMIQKSDLQVVTERMPSDQEIDDMLFAFRVAKHVKSNAIVYAREGATVGIGAGQMSRLDSSRIAARKAIDATEACGASAPLTQNCVVASDAFFPFADGLLAAAEAGARAVIQPGGSMRDKDVIAAADEAGLAMVFTGARHFRH